MLNPVMVYIRAHMLLFLYHMTLDCIPQYAQYMYKSSVHVKNLRDGFPTKHTCTYLYINLKIKQINVLPITTIKSQFTPFLKRERERERQLLLLLGNVDSMVRFRLHGCFPNVDSRLFTSRQSADAWIYNMSFHVASRQMTMKLESNPSQAI